MSETEQALLTAALALPVESRAQLADALWDSLPEDQLDLSIDADLSQAWADEARQRMADVRSGKTPLIPGSDVIDRLNARMKS